MIYTLPGWKKLASPSVISDSNRSPITVRIVFRITYPIKPLIKKKFTSLSSQLAHIVRGDGEINSTFNFVLPPSPSRVTRARSLTHASHNTWRTSRVRTALWDAPFLASRPAATRGFSRLEATRGIGPYFYTAIISPDRLICRQNHNFAPKVGRNPRPPGEDDVALWVLIFVAFIIL